MIVGARPHNSMRNIFFKSSEDLIVDRSICSALLLKSPRVGPRVAQESMPLVELDKYVKPELVAIHPQVENKEELFANFATQFGQISLELTYTKFSSACSGAKPLKTRAFATALPCLTQP